MIRINLLPADLRRGNRIPAKVLATAFASALVVSGALGWFGLVYFGDLAAAEQRLADVELKLAARTKKVVYFDDLEKNQKEYAGRVQTIQDIGKSRRVWSQFLDELIDVINNNGDTERHLAWCDGIAMKNDPKKGAIVSMPSYVQMQDREKDRIANLHEDIEASPIAKGLVSKSEPTFEQVVDKQRVPPVALSFPLSLQYAPTIVDPKAKGKPAAKK
ncbi:MAG: hypothetical protein JNN13_11905 [Planctomycetes bacterium]|nr:hypothetical protein [Planctomycetota bacterium]MBZ0153975.1 hypothetical protein [Planctomycetota bacterium]MCC7399195.1 hypothetical protein [Planctomycetota bacterium]